MEANNVSKAELLERIDRSFAALEEAIQPRINNDARPLGSSGWSIKDHYTHLAAWTQALVEMLTGELMGFSHGIRRNRSLSMSKANGFPIVLNKSMEMILRSPLHGLVSGSLLLITFPGRKSGKSYTTPISYSKHGKRLYAFTRAGWWKNLRQGARVTLRLQGRDVAAVAEALEDKEFILTGLKEHLEKVPGNANVYQVALDPVTGPNDEDLSRAAQTVVMLRIQPC